jgi:hypothetical protein
MIGFMLIFFCLYFKADTVDELPVGALITGMVSITAGYIGLQVANNGVTGKFYRPELDDRNRRDADAVSADGGKERK